MKANSNGAVWPGSLEAAAFHEQAREAAQELLRRLEQFLSAGEDPEGDEVHWGHVGSMCRVHALLDEALRVHVRSITNS